jgi:hypothetical protein
MYNISVIGIVTMNSPPYNEYILIIKFIIKKKESRAPVAHIYNPSYSGGRDMEDRGSKPAQANSSQDPISKTPSQKWGWWSGSR